MHTFLLVIYLTLSISEQCYQVRLTLMRREGQGWGVRGWLCSSFLRGGWAAEPEPLTSSSQTHPFKGFGLACAQPLLARAQDSWCRGVVAPPPYTPQGYLGMPQDLGILIGSFSQIIQHRLLPDGAPKALHSYLQSTTFPNNAHPSLSLLWSKHIGHFVSQIISGCLPIPSGLCLFSVRSLLPTSLCPSTCLLSQPP